MMSCCANDISNLMLIDSIQQKLIKQYYNMDNMLKYQYSNITLKDLKIANQILIDNLSCIEYDEMDRFCKYHQPIKHN
jgi:hypothetical protein